MRKLGPEGFDDQQRIIRIRAQNADGPGPFPFIMNTSDERADIVRLAGAFRPVPRLHLCLLPVARLRGPCRSGCIVTWDFSIQSTQVTVAEDIEQ